LLMPARSLHDHTSPLVAALQAASKVEVVTSAGTLTVERGTRPVMMDDGRIDRDDAACGAVVSNLPAGSLYWTVIEDGTRGNIALVDGSVLAFGDGGRVIDGEYAGERVAHLGIATNPLVIGAIGWTIVDEHRSGAVFLALGENRYMGGQNQSAINVDLIPASPTVIVGDVTVVEHGVLVADSDPRT
jgi:leucyl aminopeptidase (aminopeptidase T)